MTSSRGGSGRKVVDFTNADDSPIIEPKSNFLLEFILNLAFRNRFIFVSDNMNEKVDHDDYLGNVDRPKTAIKRTGNTAPQFDEDAADLLPD